MLAFRRVDSRDDARVQLADLVAGVVRRVSEERFADGPGLPAVEIGHLVAEDSVVLAQEHQGQRSSRKNTSQPRSSAGTS
jgi:hypothetical protein